MAAAVTTVKVVAAGSLARGPWDEDDSQIGNKTLRWARVACTQDAGDYTTGGQAVDILGALDDYGWSVITGGFGDTYTTNSVLSRPELNDANHATAGSRKVIWRLTTTGAELVNASGTETAGTFYMTVFGY